MNLVSARRWFAECFKQSIIKYVNVKHLTEILDQVSHKLLIIIII